MPLAPPPPAETAESRPSLQTAYIIKCTIISRRQSFCKYHGNAKHEQSIHTQIKHQEQADAGLKHEWQKTLGEMVTQSYSIHTALVKFTHRKLNREPSQCSRRASAFTGDCNASALANRSQLRIKFRLHSARPPP